MAFDDIGGTTPSPLPTKKKDVHPQPPGGHSLWHEPEISPVLLALRTSCVCGTTRACQPTIESWRQQSVDAWNCAGGADSLSRYGMVLLLVTCIGSQAASLH